MQWEYKVLKFVAQGSFATTVRIDDLDGQLKQLGAEGWELTAALPPSGSNSASTLIFKRQKELSGGRVGSA